MSNYTRSETINKGPTVAHGHPSLRDAEHEDIDSATKAFIANGGTIEHVEPDVFGMDYTKKHDKGGRKIK